MARGQLGDLAEPAGEREPRDRMAAQVLERAADKGAHVDQRHVGQTVDACTACSEIEPVAAATWASQQARATSMPRWMA